MLKTVNRCVAVIMLLLLTGFCRLYAQKPSFIRFSVTIPVESAALDFSDLDVRDENNRPIKSFVRKQELQSLFESSLYQIASQNLTHRRRLWLEFLTKAGSWGEQGWIRRVVVSLVKSLAITPRKFDFVICWVTSKTHTSSHMYHQSSGHFNNTPLIGRLAISLVQSSQLLL